jgi:hypothetical protein
VIDFFAIKSHRIECFYWAMHISHRGGFIRIDDRFNESHGPFVFIVFCSARQAMTLYTKWATGQCRRRFYRFDPTVVKPMLVKIILLSKAITDIEIKVVKVHGIWVIRKR